MGEQVQVLTSVTPDRMPLWHVEDPAMATVSGKGSDWNLYVAYVQLLKPGGIYFRAELNGESAEALIASVDPQTSSTPFSPPSGFPRVANSRTMKGTRVISDLAAWNTFVAEVTSDPVETPNLDFEKRSLVAVVADLPEYSFPPVVTHIQFDERETVTVVQPSVRNSDTATTSSSAFETVISLLEIPKVSTTAQVEMRTLPPSR